MPTGGQIILKKHPSFFYSLKYHIISLIILIIGIYINNSLLIVLAIVLFLLFEVIRMATSYYLLDIGILREYDFLSKNKKFVEYDKIQNLELSQTFLQRILNVGDIKFDTSGSDSYEIYFDNVPNPREVENIVRDMINNIP